MRAAREQSMREPQGAAQAILRLSARAVIEPY
jgi:hypothetical protein